MATHGHIDEAEIAAYAPYIVAIPTSPNFETVEFAPIPRPPEFGGVADPGDPETDEQAADDPVEGESEPLDEGPRRDMDTQNRRTVPPSEALRGLRRTDDW
jgi:hypothetical protein